MTEDAPDELAHELFSKALYPGHPLGRQVLGTEPTIQSMGRSVITGYHDAHYRPENLVVSVAGNLRHEEVVDRVERRLVGKVGGREPRIATGAAERASSVSVLTRATEQAHLVLGMPALSWDDPDRYALEIVNQVLGGGMSSRLFQEVRERRGLAYEVYSHRGTYDDGGYLAIYAGTAPAGERRRFSMSSTVSWIDSSMKVALVRWSWPMPRAMSEEPWRSVWRNPPHA